MSHVHSYTLGIDGGQYSVTMPKRARPIAVGHAASGQVLVFAMVSHDADTRAFDVGHHQRHFVITGAEHETPADGVYIGMDQYQKPAKPVVHRFVFEVPGIRGSR